METNNNTTQQYVSPGGIPYSYSGREDVITVQRLQAGETCKVTGVGNSMTPILKSHQPVICIPVTESTELHKKDIVLCKVNGAGRRKDPDPGCRRHGGRRVGFREGRA